MPSGNVFIIIFNKTDPRPKVIKTDAFNCMSGIVHNVLNIHSLSQAVYAEHTDD